MAVSETELVTLIENIEKQILYLSKDVNSLNSSLKSVQKRLKDLEKDNKETAQAVKNVDDDDIDLFASDEEEDAAAEELKAKRAAEYAAKKSKKPTLIAKSSVVLDVKPWDDETDVKKLEESVRSVQIDGLVWGASKLVPVAFGVQKLQIVCVVEDDKVSIEELSEKIEAFEDYVQSVDVAAFNKI